MQRKLKSVFRSSRRKKSDASSQASQHDPTSPSRTKNVHRRGQSLDERRHFSSDSSNGASFHQARSRPVSTIYNDQPMSNDSGSHLNSSDPSSTSILTDYKAYLPALSPVEDSNDDQYRTLGGDRRVITGESYGYNEEDVADRNIQRYRTSMDASKRKPLPDTPDTPGSRSTEERAPHKSPMGNTPLVPTTLTSKYSLGSGVPTKGGLADSILPHSEVTPHNRHGRKDRASSPTVARDEAQVQQSKHRPRGSTDSNDYTPTPPSPIKNFSMRQTSKSYETDPAERAVAATSASEAKKVAGQLLDGVVDLNDTVDTDKDVRYAPTVVHEVIKPHEHEIVQHKIYREIHNYEYHHRVQPIYDLQVLPPRHWIPKINGEGLMEISADQLPTRMGDNRRWEIVMKHVPLDAFTMPQFRTEPEIIQHPSSITDDGFERKETTILHPPTLADLTDYDGLVQPVHFDHKTGKRWLGQITTMNKVHEQVEEVENAEFMNMKQLSTDLPGLSAVPDLSPRQSATRKPLNAENTIRVV